MGSCEGTYYGSVSESQGRTTTVLISGSSSESSSLDEFITNNGQDLYQRQPLLEVQETSCNNLPGVVVNGNASYDSDTSSGTVKISMPSPSREGPRYPQEKFKTLLAFLFLTVNMTFTTFSLSLTHERVPITTPLPDIVFELFEIQPWGLTVSEILILVSVYSCILVILLHRYRYIVFRRIFLVMGLLYMYRAITMYVTVLPVANPGYYCSPKANITSTVLIMKRMASLISGFGLSINGHHTFCGDYIYSGHTVCLVLSYLIIREYTPRRWWPLHWLFGSVALLGVTLLLISRGHYTVDCLIAYFITTRLFYIYHTLANNNSLKVCSPNNLLERLWWYRFFQYFECNVQGVVPRHYEWPLPWPRRFATKHRQRTS